MSIFAERANGDRGDVALVNRGCGNCEIWPTHDIAGANLRRPPVQRIRGEHSWAQECPLESGGFDLALDFFAERTGTVGLLKQRMRSFERGEKDDAAGVLRNALDDGRDGGRRRDPDEEDCVDAVEAVVEGMGRVRSPCSTSTWGGKLTGSGLRLTARIFTVSGAS